jgi:hypothetical protein
LLCNEEGMLEGIADPAAYDVVICHPSYATQLAALKAKCPDTRFIVYRNEIAAAKGTDTIAVSVSWADADAHHPDWFLADQQGKRLVLHDYPSNAWMDQGNGRYQQQWADNAVSQCESEGWHGVFIDDHNSHVSAHLADGLRIPRYLTEQANRAASRAFGATVCMQLRRAGLITIANTGFLFAGAGRWQQRFSELGGAADVNMCENWAVPSGRGGFTGQDWDYQQAQLSQCTGVLKRGFLATTYAGSDAARDYAWASLLMGYAVPGSAYVQSPVAPGRDPGLPADIGLPTGPRKLVAPNCYSRPFETGVLYVNADSRSHTIDGIRLGSASTVFDGSPRTPGTPGR